MIDLLTRTKNNMAARVIDNAQACYRLDDRAGLEQNARLALDVAMHTSDERGSSIACILLGIARRETWWIASAARSFEHSFDYGNAAVALCILATVEPSRAERLVILHRAQGNIERAKMRLAQRGDLDGWARACDVERAIQASVGRVVDGREWVG